MIQTPEKECPVGSVPDTCACENDKLIDNSPDLPLTVTAERNIQILLEPRRQ